jgi:hypothetical protein
MVAITVRRMSPAIAEEVRSDLGDAASGGDEIEDLRRDSGGFLLGMRAFHSAARLASHAV